MVRFEKLIVPEKIYPYIDAVSAADYSNGTFGDIVSGVFTAGAGFKAIMQVELGDDKGFNTFKVKANEHVRIADFSKTIGVIVNITEEQLPANYKENDVLVPTSEGALKVGSATADGFKVIEVTNYGVRAEVVASTVTTKE